MAFKGIRRSVDKMGRVVIPKEMRKQLNIENDVDSFEIFLDGDKIILKKFNSTCLFCDSLKECVVLEGYTVCFDCIEKLRLLKEETIENSEN